jgi:lysophospholipase L1-like esterase
MNYQNVLCLGDSQTYGARTYGCYPLHLAKLLTAESRYAWRALNHSANGFTARDLWFLLNERLSSIPDTYQTCLLIGTNDVGRRTDLGLFGEYYRQALRALSIAGHQAVFCGEVPPIHSDGHSFFPREVALLREGYNEVIREVVAEVDTARLVDLSHLTAENYVDPVHFNEAGNVAVARAFADALLAQ